MREHLFQLAHDNLGHFSTEKSYTNLWDDYYWPNIRCDLTKEYVPGCINCQRNKGTTSKPLGPLHPLPTLDGQFNSVVIDFIRPLPKDDGFDAIVTMTDHLRANIQIVPCTMTTTAEEFVFLFFDRWYCENGCPLKIISDQDKVFISKFWKTLMKLPGIHYKMLMSYHPQTDGSSEHSNKTVIQCLRFHVK